MKSPSILSERHRPILFCQEIILCSRIPKRTFSPIQATTSGRFIPKRDIRSTKADKNRPDTVRTAAGYRNIGKTGQRRQTGIATGPVSTGWRLKTRRATQRPIGAPLLSGGVRPKAATSAAKRKRESGRLVKTPELRSRTKRAGNPGLHKTASAQIKQWRGNRPVPPPRIAQLLRFRNQIAPEIRKTAATVRMA